MFQPQNRSRDLHELVLNDIQELAAQAMKDSDAFYQRLSRRMENQYRTDTSAVRTEIRRLEERNQEIDDVFLNLYTDKSKGIISEQRFLKLTDAMEQEQNSNKARLSELNLLLHSRMNRKAMFMPLSRKSASMPPSRSWTKLY